MELTKLQEDLLHEFKEQKEIIEKQLEMLGPLEARLHKRAATRLLGKSWLLLMEIVCYTLAGGSIALAVLMDKVYPFAILREIRKWPEMQNEYTYINNPQLMEGHMNVFEIVLAAICCVAGLLFFIIGRNLSSIRRKNDIIHNVGKDIKTLVGQHLNRKAAIHSVESRHFMNDGFQEAVKDEDKWVNDI